MSRQEELFDTVLRGYDKQQVAKYFEELMENHARQQESMQTKTMALAEQVASAQEMGEGLRKDLAESMFALGQNQKELSDCKGLLDVEIKKNGEHKVTISELEDRLLSCTTLREELNRNLKDTAGRLAVAERSVDELESRVDEYRELREELDRNLKIALERAESSGGSMTEMENKLQESLTMRTELDRNLKIFMEKAAISERTIARLEEELASRTTVVQSAPQSQPDYSQVTEDEAVIIKTRETRERMLNKARQLREEILAQANSQAQDIILDAHNQYDDIMQKVKDARHELQQLRSDIAQESDKPHSFV